MNQRKHICSDTAFLLWHLAISFFFMGYFLPATIAYARYSRAGNGVFWVNFLLGWSGIGWLGALIWAIVSPKREA